MDGVVFKCTEPLTPRCLSVPSHNFSISAAPWKWTHPSKKSLHPVLNLKNCQPLGGKDLGSFSKGIWQGSMDTFTFYSLCFSKTRNECGVYLTLKSQWSCTSMHCSGGMWKPARRGTWQMLTGQKSFYFHLCSGLSWHDLNVLVSSMDYKQLGFRTQFSLHHSQSRTLGVLQSRSVMGTQRGSAVVPPPLIGHHCVWIQGS